MSLLAYRLITALLAPVVAFGLLVRGDGRQAVGQRLGLGPLPVSPHAKTLWFHAASVGEYRALKPLICRDWGRPVVLTVQSRQGLAVARQNLPPSILIRPAPLDAPGWFDRFLRKLQPDALILVESELWPGWMQALQAAGVPVVLLDGALSERSAQQWARWRGLARPVAGALQRVTVASEARKAVFERLGFGPVEQALPLKLAGQPLGVDSDLVAQWQDWLAGATPVILANVYRSDVTELRRVLEAQAPNDTKIIIAPRHPEHTSAIRAGFGEASARVAYWTGFGTLGSLYALGGTVIMGGGFDARVGSHNPLEALRAGCQVMCGPHAGKQAELIALLEQRGMITRAPVWPASQNHANALTDLGQQAHKQAVHVIETVLKITD